MNILIVYVFRSTIDPLALFPYCPHQHKIRTLRYDDLDKVYIDLDSHTQLMADQEDYLNDNTLVDAFTILRV